MDWNYRGLPWLNIMEGRFMPKYLAVTWCLRHGHMLIAATCATATINCSREGVVCKVMSCSSNLKVFVRAPNALCTAKGHKLSVLPDV